MRGRRGGVVCGSGSGGDTLGRAAGVALLEALPAALELLFLLRGDRGIRTALAEECKAQPVGLVGGVNGGGDFVQAAGVGGQVGQADGWAVVGGMLADLEQRTAESRAAAFGDVAAVFAIAGLGGAEVEAGHGPDVAGAGEPGDVADVTGVTGGAGGADAGDGIHELRIRGGDQRRQGGFGARVAGGKGGVGLIVGLQTLGVDGGDGWGRQRGVLQHLQDRCDGLGAGAVAVVVKEADQAAGAERPCGVGIGTVQEQNGQPVVVEGVGADNGRRRLQFGMGRLELLEIDDGAGP